jgi:hypothetical protein
MYFSGSIRVTTAEKLVFGRASRQAKSSGHFISNLEALDHGAASLDREIADARASLEVGDLHRAVELILIAAMRHGTADQPLAKGRCKFHGRAKDA